MLRHLRQVLQFESVRFLLVGVLNTIFGYGCFVFFLYLGFHYVIAILLSTILGVLFNFKSIGVLVFKSHDNRLIVRFFAAYFVIYLLNLAGIKALSYLNFTPAIGGAILVLPMAVTAYFLNKVFVFKKIDTTTASENAG